MTLHPAPARAVAEGNVQVFAVSAATTISEMLMAGPAPIEDVDQFAREQLKDPDVMEIIRYLDSGELPAGDAKARKLVAQAF